VTRHSFCYEIRVADHHSATLIFVETDFLSTPSFILLLRFYVLRLSVLFRFRATIQDVPAEDYDDSA